MATSFSAEIAARGYHVYNTMWNARVGEVFYASLQQVISYHTVLMAHKLYDGLLLGHAQLTRRLWYMYILPPEQKIVLKLDEFKLLYLFHFTDIICFIKTWFSTIILNFDFNFRGYTLFQLNHDCRGGYVTISINSFLSPSLISLHLNSS